MGRVKGQGQFRFPNGWGGNRKYLWAERQKRRGKKVPVPHDRRGAASRARHAAPARGAAEPPEAGDVRSRAAGPREGLRALRLPPGAVLGADEHHLHLIAEAPDRRALSRGMRGLTIHIAKALNRLRRRKGKVFAERYHDVSLSCPKQIRNALLYVLDNRFRHGERPRGRGPDPFSSGRWFDGWRDLSPTPRGPSPLPCAKGYLLARLWRRQGLLRVHERPASSPAPAETPRAGHRLIAAG